MAMIGLHKETIAYPEIWLAILKCCDCVQFVSWQDNDVAVFRVQGEGLPAEDKMCTLDLSLFPGILPFVSKINVSEQIWQPLNT